jgi:hypothetical protein
LVQRQKIKDSKSVTYRLTVTPPHCRPRPNPYDDDQLPRQAAYAGRCSAETFHRLSPAEQRKIVVRMMTGLAQYNAHRAGKPPPIFLDEYGRPLSPELGGDCRGVEALGEEVTPSDPSHPDLQKAAEWVKAQLKEINRNSLPPPAKKTG